MSETARLQRSPGSVTGPPRKFIICHDGRTIRVSEQAAAAHFDQHPGDAPGPCQGKTVVCHNGKTLIIDESALDTHTGHGDSDGPCPGQMFMCNLRVHTIVVDANGVEDHLAHGQILGLCPGKNLLCHNGRTIIVSNHARQWHLQSHTDDKDGYCLDGAGPIVTGIPPTSASR